MPYERYSHHDRVSSISVSHPYTRALFPSNFRLSQSPGLTLGFEETQDVVFADWALDVADDGSGGVVHELDANLGNASTGAGTSKDTGNFDQLDGGLGCVHDEVLEVLEGVVRVMWSDLEAGS